jgi:drug/metabolite transporter (DMT)-like permease
VLKSKLFDKGKIGMKKWIAIIVASIAVILVCFGVIFTRQQNQSVTPTKNRSGLRIQKQKTSNSKKGDAQY